MALKKLLDEYIDTYVSRAELRSFGNLKGFDSATVDRELRHLTGEGKIKPDFKKTEKGREYIVGYFKGTKQTNLW